MDALHRGRASCCVGAPDRGVAAEEFLRLPDKVVTHFDTWTRAPILHPAPDEDPGVGSEVGR